jgi:recombination protein RecR
VNITGAGATVEPVARLIDEFHRLPGIGPKTAQRLAYYLLRMPAQQAHDLANAIVEVKERVILCGECFNITDTDPCGICASEGRDRKRVCVVEEPLDVLAIERTREYRGLYHVLHGALSPLENIGPEDLKIAELKERVRNGQIEEVILATNPNQVGDATAFYIQRELSSMGKKLTRLARGLPMGGDLEYADDVTLSRALANRQEIS